MAEPFIGEIRLFGYGEAPQGWALCDGSELEVSQHEPLYDLLDNQFGGDGDEGTFCLPDLRGRVPLGAYQGSRPEYSLLQGTIGGEEAVTLKPEEIYHRHQVRVSSASADERDPTDAALAATEEGRDVYKKLSDEQLAAPLPGEGLKDPDPVYLNLGALTETGAGSVQPHENMQPYLVLNFCIALAGLNPPIFG